MHSKFPRGSQWRRWDLHFHTPSSYDYRDKSVSNEQIISELLNNQIAVVAVTDHHCIDTARIKELQRLAGANLTVLPGIEFRCELGGSESVHFIGIFSDQSNIEEIWVDLQSNCKLKDSDISAKGHENIYCDLHDTAKLIRNLGGIVSVHAGGKSNTIESIKNNHSFKRQLKTDLVRECIDIFELGAVDDQDDYNEKVFPAINMRRPMIICSDNHDVKNYDLKEKLWIKADPSFEGLKQIIHEPEDRVKIQPSIPEDKAGYQVIDRIEIRSSYIYNHELPLNANLNSVIGGRSAGKSVLLAAIAKKLKTERPVKFEHNLEYDEFVGDISMGLKIIWKDQEENDQREIEYFQQGYMYDLARKEDKLSSLVETILRQKGKEGVLVAYDAFVADNKKRISTSINELFQNMDLRMDKKKKASDKGDRKGIEDEIKRLQEEMQKVKTIEINDEDRVRYTAVKDELDKLTQLVTTINQDIERIEALKVVSSVRDSVDFELTNISQLRKSKISSKYRELKAEFESKWKAFLEEEIIELKKQAESIPSQEDALKKDSFYNKVVTAYQDSTHLRELEERIAHQKTKLFELTTMLAEIVELERQFELSKTALLGAHKLYYQRTFELLPSLSEATDGLEIKAKAKFDLKRYRDILSSALNLQGYTNQSLVQFEFKDNAGYDVHLSSVFLKVLSNELTLKGGYTNQSLLMSLLTECFYSVSYDIEYDGDDFGKMSDGKKAFVVLKLLLDFSTKDCPILIDQPEDDLDNRAIYQDLVQYLKKKKKVRQILLATHNPNIVVGADSEVIIAANQDGVKNFNRDRKKFQYISGSLEHTCQKDADTAEILESQGIREHICEILEGGNRAFKLRE
ncbi:MAG TPA: hypothetical protein VFR58_05045, partial [Flavisolibacter sp.]|nr:hypothetical protein [Flavisolibacter sp.]